MPRVIGKKITTWKLRTADGTTIGVPVRLVEPSFKDPYFCVQMPERGIDQQELTLVELKTKVAALLLKQTVLEWEPYILVNPPSSGGEKFKAGVSDGVTMEFHVDFIEVAKGGKGMLFYRYHPTDRPEELRCHYQSLVRDTPANRNRLLAYLQNIDRLVCRFEDAFPIGNTTKPVETVPALGKMFNKL